MQEKSKPMIHSDNFKNHSYSNTSCDAMLLELGPTVVNWYSTNCSVLSLVVFFGLSSWLCCCFTCILTFTDIDYTDMHFAHGLNSGNGRTAATEYTALHCINIYFKDTVFTK